jgi:PleD family two-component response regulator
MADEAVDLGNGQSAQQTVSIGGASWNSHEGPEELEKRAAEALYSAKLHGGNRLHFDDE